MSNQEPQKVVIAPPKGTGSCLMLFIAFCVLGGILLAQPWKPFPSTQPTPDTTQQD